MNSEIVIAIKDSVKLNILHEVLSNNISLSFQLNNGNDENYSSQIHNEKSRVKVYGKYNISEDPTGEFLTIRPVAPDCKMTIKASVPVGVNGKKISVVRSSTREIEKEFEITPDVSSIEFIPCGKQGYTLRVVYGDSYINQTVLEDSNSSSNTQANNTSSPFTDFAVIPENPSKEENRIFFNAIKDGQQLYRAGLFEAATAVAISAKAGLERLGYTIDDKVSEWDRQYELFTMKLSYLQAKVQQELKDWEDLIGIQNNNDAQQKKIHLIEINYWSKGDFADVVQGVKKYQQIVSHVTDMGKEVYLKQADSANTDELKEYISEIEKLDQKFLVLSPLYKQRYSASCERADWGESIIDFLTGEINLLWHEELTGYKEASSDAKASKDFRDYVQSHFDDLSITEDTREWLKLVFENASENQIFIYILPLEAHGNVVNHIVIHVDYGGPEQEMYSRDLYQHVCEAIQYTEDGDGIVNYAKDVNELKLSENKIYSETGKDIEQMKRMSRN